MKFGVVGLLCCLLTLAACSGGGGDDSPAATPTVTYTVTFDSQGGSAVTAQTVTQGAAAAVPTEPKLSFRTFGGWYKEAACTNVFSFATEKVTANVTLYAKWTWNSWQTFDVLPKLGAADGTILDMTWDASGNLYVVGNFDTFNGQAIDHVAKWDGAAWSQVGTGYPVSGGFVQAICIDGSGNIYIGGNFYSVPAGGPRYFAKLDKADNTWKPLGDDFDGFVMEITCDSSGNLYVGGSYTQSGANAGFNNVAKWNGSAWSKLGTGVTITSGTASVSKIYFNEAETELWMQGSFDNAGGVAATAFSSGMWASYNLSSGVWAKTNIGGKQPIAFKESGVRYVKTALNYTGYSAGDLPGYNAKLYNPNTSSWTETSETYRLSSDGFLLFFGCFTKLTYDIPTGASHETTAKNLAYWNGTDWAEFVGGTTSLNVCFLEGLCFAPASGKGDIWAYGPETSDWKNYRLIKLAK